MTATRRIPVIGKVESEQASSCTEGLLGLIFWGFVTFIFVRVMAGTTGWERGMCVGLILVFLVLLYRGNLAQKRAKEEWRLASRSDWLTIVDRDGHPGGTFEDGYGDTHSYRSSYHLELAMNADQRAVAPQETIVRVDISGGLYNHLLGRNSVCIYYHRTAPLAFFISEEFHRH